MRSPARTAISLLFFLQFFVFGTYQPIMSLYCRDCLSLSGFQIGIILSTSTISSFLAPAVTIILADRLIRSENLLGILQILTGIFLAMIPFAKNFFPLFLIYLMMMIFSHPTNALLNAITFKNLGNEGTDFGSVRVWGTFGWIGAALFFSFFWMDPDIAFPFQKTFGSIFFVAAAASLAGSGLLFSSLKILDIKNKELPRKEKIALIKNIKSIPPEIKKSLSGFLFICFLISVQDKYYFLGISPFLKDSDFLGSRILSVISVGMVSEVFFMIILRRLLKRFGMKKIMAAGAGASLIRYLIFLIFKSKVMITAGIFFHGFIFALFMTTAFIYLDSFCADKNRAAFHQFYTIITSGAGSLAGNIIGGILFDISLCCFGGYFIFWLFPALISLAALLLIPKFISRR